MRVISYVNLHMLPLTLFLLRRNFNGVPSKPYWIRGIVCYRVVKINFLRSRNYPFANDLHITIRVARGVRRN